jgi:CheY-like chemotaxis protein
MGGDLTVTSLPGQGSTFRLTVTVAATEGAQPSRAGAPSARAGKPLRVLCAEDNPFARVVLNTVLGEFGYRVDFVGSGEAAVAAVAKGYDLVLMDLMLPGLDGIAAVRAIRALNGAGTVPIIGISGRTEPGQREAALAAGMNAFLGKPVSPAALAQAIAEIIR